MLKNNPPHYTKEESLRLGLVRLGLLSCPVCKEEGACGTIMMDSERPGMYCMYCGEFLATLEGMIRAIPIDKS